jgi:c-di-GMP-binding flagellar brake protein YcgR
MTTATKRRHYRVTGDDLNGIEISMLVGTTPRPVHLMDISAAGAAIAFLESTRTEVETMLRSSREAPTVRIESQRLAESLEIACRVAHLHEVSAGVICGVAFLRRVDETVNLDKALLRVFNRRGAVRIEPDSSVPIQVSICDENGTTIATGRMRDLSLTGIGITVQPQAVATVANGTAVRLRFSIDGEAFDLESTVRFGRTLSETPPGEPLPVTTGILGIEFDPEAREKPANRRRLADWVMGRQREIQRIQRESAGSSSRG